MVYRYEGTLQVCHLGQMDPLLPLLQVGEKYIYVAVQIISGSLIWGCSPSKLLLWKVNVPSLLRSLEPLMDLLNLLLDVYPRQCLPLLLCLPSI